jgi:membrane protein
MPRPSARADRVSLWRVIGWGIAYALINQRERFTGAAAASRSRPPAAGRNRESNKSSPSVHGRGRDAESPAEIPTRGWKDIAWRVYDEIGNDRVLAVAAGVTFYALLAIFPAISAFISLYGLVADPAIINEHLAALSGVLPGGALEIVGEQVKRITSQPSGTLGVSFFISLAMER